ANPFAFGIGFVLATGLLHLGGIGFGFLIGSRAGRIAVRATGAGIALMGGAFLFGFA
ncbi:MAG: HupE/UreJ family protein, partial [Maritimibacter sp.]